jgi:hypothetical protein
MYIFFVLCEFLESKAKIPKKKPSDKKPYLETIYK